MCSTCDKIQFKEYKINVQKYTQHTRLMYGSMYIVYVYVYTAVSCMYKRVNVRMSV